MSVIKKNLWKVAMIFFLLAFHFNVHAQYEATYNINTTSVTTIPVYVGQNVTLTMGTNSFNCNGISGISLLPDLKSPSSPIVNDNVISQDITIPEYGEYGDTIHPYVTDENGTHPLANVVIVVGPAPDTTQELPHAHLHLEDAETRDSNSNSKWWWLLFTAGGFIIGYSIRK